MTGIRVRSSGLAAITWAMVVIGLTAGLAFARVTAASPQAAPPASGISPDQMAALMDDGETVYGTNCSECHKEGGVGPTLDGDSKLANEDTVIRQILKGSANHNMPPFGPTLTDRQIASVGTFIRNSWDNTFGPVLEAEVAHLRETLKNAK